MKILTYTLFALTFFSALPSAFTQESVPQTVSDILLDDVHPDSTKSAIDKAVANKQSDLLFVAMHNKSVALQIYCLDKIGTLARAIQAPLISRLLLDDSLLARKDELSMRDLNAQTEMQVRLEHMSYKSLNQLPPNFHGLLNRSEVANLTASLQTVQ